MAKRRENAQTPLVGMVLKSYRKTHHLTQEQLAVTLQIEPRTYRAYENGEYPLNNIHELRRIADTLGIDAERFGVTPALSTPKTVEQFENITRHVWSLMEQVRVDEARLIVEKLASDAQTVIATENTSLLYGLARVYHVAGYVTSMKVRTDEVPLAIHYYHEMETIARLIGDDTLLNIALTYQGDMYRRLGEFSKAITYLEAARDTTPQASADARGNGLQLLARAYLPTKNVAGFVQMMAEAEQVAALVSPESNDTVKQYNLGTVYEEYAKYYASSGQTYKAMDYLDKAEAVFARTENWRILLLIARAEALIFGGEIETGLPLAAEAAALSRRQGHQRRLERIYGMKRFLHQQSLRVGKAEMELSDALEGPIEYWDIHV